MTRRASFPERLRTKTHMAGVFQKFPAHQAVELIAQTGIDFIVLDAEHAPFDLSQIDASILASHASDMPLLVRVPRNAPDVILAALDMGASGVFVPHVRSAEDARAAVKASRYGGGGRGFSPSTRAGGYGARGLQDYMQAADAEVAVVAQIEDGAALDNLHEIVRTPGLSAVFVGRADLAVSLGVDWNDPRLDHATAALADAARDAGMAAGSYLADTSCVATFLDLGLSFFVIGSDQGALKSELSRNAQAFKRAVQHMEGAP